MEDSSTSEIVCTDTIPQDSEVVTESEERREIESFYRVYRETNQ
jgi:hypothetical protein